MNVVTLLIDVIILVIVMVMPLSLKQVILSRGQLHRKVASLRQTHFLISKLSGASAMGQHAGRWFSQQTVYHTLAWLVGDSQVIMGKWEYDISTETWADSSLSLNFAYTYLSVCISYPCSDSDAFYLLLSLEKVMCFYGWKRHNGAFKDDFHIILIFFPN